jgi:hypothetical protein
MDYVMSSYGSIVVAAAPYFCKCSYRLDLLAVGVIVKVSKRPHGQSFVLLF